MLPSRRRVFMNAKVKQTRDDDVWEDRALGADEAFAEVAPDINDQVDAALDLHPISIRLQRGLVDNLKALAQLNGLGYQPLIRQILQRWVDSEIKVLVAQRVNETTSASKASPRRVAARKESPGVTAKKAA
jgi:hypothetical protein